MRKVDVNILKKLLFLHRLSSFITFFLHFFYKLIFVSVKTMLCLY